MPCAISFFLSDPPAAHSPMHLAISDLSRAEARTNTTSMPTLHDIRLPQASQRSRKKPLSESKKTQSNKIRLNRKRSISRPSHKRRVEIATIAISLLPLSDSPRPFSNNAMYIIPFYTDNAITCHARALTQFAPTTTMCETNHPPAVSPPV